MLVSSIQHNHWTFIYTVASWPTFEEKLNLELIRSKPTSLCFLEKTCLIPGSMCFQVGRQLSYHRPLISLIFLFFICFPQYKYIIIFQKNVSYDPWHTFLETMTNAYKLILSHEKEKLLYSCYQRVFSFHGGNLPWKCPHNNI